jgi:chromosome segregation ATPase
VGDSQMKLSEQAQLDNQIAMLEMELDKTTKQVMEFEKLIDKLEVKVNQLKLIIKSLSEVL